MGGAVRCGAVGPAVLLGDSRRNGGGLGGTAEEGDEPSGLREGAASKRVLPYGFQRGIAARPGMGETPEERRAPHGSAPRPLPSVCSSIPHSPLMSAAVRAHGGTSPSGWRIPRAVRYFPCIQHSDPSPYPCPGAAPWRSADPQLLTDTRRGGGIRGEEAARSVGRAEGWGVPEGHTWDGETQQRAHVLAGGMESPTRAVRSEALPPAADRRQEGQENGLRELKPIVTPSKGAH